MTDFADNDVTNEEEVDEAFVFPASFNQQRLWFIDQLMPGSSMYNMPLAIRLNGILDVAALEDSLNEIVWRHETLRTTFEMEEDGQLLQVVVPELTLPLPVVNLEGLAAAEQEQQVRTLTEEEIHTPFDLAKGPLIRALLLRQSDAEHVLVVNMHHIISDGWSIGIFTRELITLYSAFSQGQDSPLEELPIQYADFAIWQRDYLTEDVIEKQLTYWKQQLGDDLGVLQLPTDRPRPPVQTQHGAVESFTLSADITQRLMQLSQRLGATLFMTLLGAFQTLLFRYTGQEKIAVGTPAAGRDQDELSGLIGFFINTLVMRTDLSGTPAFTDVIKRAKETALGAYAHQDIPFERLVDEIQPNRDMSVSPLFQVMFALQNTPVSKSERADFSISPVEFDVKVSKFDITLQLIENPNGMVGSFEYNTDLFDRATIVRMISHFSTLLEGIAANPETPIHQLPILTAEEQHQLLTEWNDNGVDYPQEVCLHELFEAQVAKTPDAIAVTFEGQHLTYREFNERANQLAHFLRKQGVGPDRMVGVSMERSLEMVLALYGILKAGGAYLPIDPTHPADRIAFTVEDSQVTLLLTQQHLVATLPEHGAKVVCLDTDWEQIAGESTANPELVTRADNLAYTIYTSGSTGKPKGAMNEHRGIVNRLLWMQDEYQLTSQDTVLQKTPFSFDVSVWEFFWPLFTGARLVIAKPEGHKDSGYLVDLIERERITTLHFVPSMLQVFLNEDRLDRCHSIRQVMCSGEALPYELQERFFARMDNAELHNLYGPTEAAVDVTYWACQRGSERQFVPIGRPVANTQLYILDQWLQPVPTGVAGELHIAGIQLARGYHNRVEMTAEKFIPNPFTAGERMYKTGDVARYLADGTIQYMGRIDHQVKIRGFRIELGEIEEVIAGHQDVREACVLVKDDQIGNKRVVAYIVPESANLQASDVRRYVRDLLPDYMVPSAVVMIDKMPLSPNGKVDRRALPEPDFSKPELEGAYVAPRNETEQILSGIWASILRVEQVGIHDNFFELGGDSILSIQIVQRASQQGIKLTPKDLFKFQTIADLAEVAGTSAVVVADQGIVTGDVLLTPVQHWFFEQNFAKAEHFNFPMLLEASEELDTAHLQNALRHLLQHHDALRLRYTKGENGWQQSSASMPSELPFTHVDLSHVAADEQEAAFTAEAANWQAGLSLQNGLVHFIYFTFGPTRPSRLFFCMHHLVMDGVSVRILLDDLHTSYGQAQHGEAMQLPPKTTSFQTWAEKLTEYAKTDAALKELSFWEQMHSKGIAPLPLDHQSGANTVDSTERVLVSLSQEETQQLLTEVPKAYNTQINDLLLTALVEAFALWTGGRSLSVTFEGHGREEIVEGVDLSRTIGWFTTMYPVLLELDGVASLGASIKAVKEQLRFIPNRGIGYGVLRYLNDGEETQALRGATDPQILFNYLGQFDQPQQAEKALFSSCPASHGRDHSAENKRSHLFDISGAVSGGQLHMSWTYSTHMHDAVTVEALADAFVKQLRDLIAHCLTPEAGGYTPSDFPEAKLSQAELDKFLSGLDSEAVANLEQLYQLSPTQEGMLFHSLLAPGTGIYMVQVNLEVQGQLDLAQMQRAWQTVLSRHTMLRTGFHWQGLEHPLQAVFRDVQMPIETLDWRNQTADEQKQSLNEFLQADMRRGFELSDAPLVRLTLVRMGDNVHRFIWTSHHLILDGWSMPLVFSEVISLYESYVQGGDLQLKAARPYRDYIAWLHSQDVNAAETFWRQKMAGFSAPTSLRVEQSRALPEGEKRYQDLHGALSPEATNDLQAAARQHGLTINTLVQGAWALLLSRYSGEEDVLFGATVSGRPTDLPGVESIIGLFINTLPMRVQFSAQDSVLNYLQTLQAEQVDVREFEYSPLSRVHEWSDVPRDRELFNTILVFENYPMGDAVKESEGTLVFTGFDSDEMTNYPITLVVVPGRQLSFKLSYDRSRFDDAMIERLGQHLTHLLINMAAMIEAPVCTIPMITEQEVAQLQAWNETSAQYPQDVTLPHLFAEQVAKTPDATALIFADETLSYRELDLRANRVAHHLQGLGVGPDQLVGLSMDRSVEMVIGLLGILKAGAAYVPLDPEYPAERVAYIVEEANVSVMLTQQHLVKRLPESSARIVCVEDLDLTKATEENAPVKNMAPEHLAYVIYTSGSTGKPKGVQIEHAALTNFLYAMQEHVGVQASDVLVSVTTISFDIAALELYLPLVNGATVVVASRETAGDSVQLAALLESSEATVMQATPATWYMLLQSGWTGRAQLKVLCGGEAFPRELVNAMVERTQEVWNVYGPTEATIWTTAARMEANDDTVLIGRPFANTTAYILDKHLQPVPLGAVGELYVGGRGLARGYLNRPDLTEAAFFPHPFSEVPGERIYKTGDLARYHADGQIECLGRVDNQVKIRGFRIELGEIESVLGQHPDVQRSAVVVREDSAGDKRIVAYFVAQEGIELDSAELRSFVKQQLTDYMVPSAWVQLAELPLTPNGKIDRRALPALDPSLIGSTEYVAPRTAQEEILAGIFADILRREQVGAHDNFFELGGHSLLATQVISRLSAAFGMQVPLRTLFEAPTVADLAAQVMLLQQAERGMEVPPIVQVSRDAHLPLSFAQQRLWVLEQLLSSSSVYNMPAAIRLQGTLHLEALRDSLSELLSRHETLRTSFAEVDGQPVQVIQEATAAQISQIDLRLLPEAQREQQMVCLVEEEAMRPFDLSQAPLIRFTLVQMSEDEHVLMLNMHHIISDGWSLGVLVREFVALYTAHVQGEKAQLTDLPIQYGDYAHWQRSWLQGDALEQQLAYWREQLGGELPVLQLPTDRPRPPVQTYNGALASFELSKETAERLTAISKRHGVTMFMTLLGAFQTLLYRYSGQEDIAVGTPIAGRSQRETEDLIGFFVNTLVLRTDLTGLPSFSELLSRVRETSLGAYAHQDVPFEKLVEELQPERDMSRSPLFQVMFTLQNASLDSHAELPGLSLSQVEFAGGVAKFDLQLTMSEHEAGLSGYFEYNTDLFDAATIERMIGHFATLIGGIAEHPQKSIADLPMFKAPERTQLLAEWNDTAVEYPSDVTLPQLFEEQVERTPDAKALIFEGESLTYRELNERVNRLAHYLRTLGVGPDMLVGVCMERSFEMVTALYAIQKAGAAYVPLDPNYPADRLQFMLEDSAATVLLTQQQLVDQLPSHAARVICLDGEVAGLHEQSAENPEPVATDRDVAYMIYTSGSTGKPKGVLNEHRGIVNRLLWMQDEYRLTSADRVLQKTPFSFDVSVWEFFWPLLTGATLVIARPEGHKDAAYLVDLINEQQITTLHFVPSMLQVFLEERGVESCTSISRVMCSGEALPFELAERFYARMNAEARLHNLYGPTEAAVDVTYYSCEPGSTLGFVPIGRPVANTQMYILDSRMNPVPVGVAGELHIAGVQLARGYHNRPDLTAEKFVRNPFGAGRLYKTGDLARYMPDGSIQYLGRLDFQVKIRGFRIELGEIEEVLALHPDVRETVVTVREDIPGDKRVVAYAVARTAVETADLRSFMAERLPEHMVPSAFVLLDEMPLSPNGKADRKRLPAPDLTQLATTEYVAPRTAVEEIVASIWADVLKLERVGRHDNFFGLGGHSLLGTQVVSRLYHAFNMQLPLRALFEAPTVSGLSAQIEQMQLAEHGLSIPPITAASREGHLPLSFAQQRLWVVDRLLTGSAVYNMPTAVRLQGELNTAALEKTLSEVLRRHEALRTSFAEIDGEPVQVIAVHQHQSLTLVDLRGLPADEREAEMHRIVQADADAPFDLTQGPLLRCSLLQLAEDDHVLVLNMHHIVSDGWSLGVLMNEIVQLYSAFAAGEASPLAELPVQYADYAAWQRNWLRDDVLDQQLSYWKQQLGGELPALELPTDRTRPAVQTHVGAHANFLLSQEVSRSLQDLSKQHGVTLFMTLLGAFQTLLARCSGQTDIAVGTPIAGRTLQETEPLIGFFVNTLVMRTDLSGAPTFAELLKRVRDVALGAYAHQDVPFEKLVEALQPERDTSRSPLFQVMFTLENRAGGAAAELPGLTLSPVDFDSNIAKFDLTLNMLETAEGLVGSIEYNTDLFDAATIERMTAHLGNLLSAVCADANKPLTEVALLSADEVQQQLIEWNDTTTDYPRASSIQQLFEQQVAETPDATAVVFQQETVTYGELNRLANKLARTLQQQGVGADTLVGLCVERSVEMIVAVLAILKAGGAYVTLDSSYPADRLAYMVEDANIRLVVTKAHLLDKLPAHDATVLVDKGWAAANAESEENLPIATAADNIAYVTYTSGSTGKPKGVAIPHRGVVRLVRGNDFVPFTSENVFLQMSSIAFDAATLEIWGALLNGARLAVLPPELPTLDGLTRALNEHEVTTIFVTSALFNQLVEHDVDAFKSVTHLLVGGDVVSAAHLRKVADRHPNCQLLNGYGPTESTTFAVVHPLTDPQPGQNVPIGRPIKNTTVYVLDAHLQPVPIGVAGELHIGGDGLAREYLNQPELTAERFIKSPFRAGERLYKTGDRVRWLADGTIEFLGRIDNQVKVRGFRIELGEIEVTLAKHPAVQEVTVLVREDVPGDKRIVAYIVAGAEVDTLELRGYVRANLPDYMVPSAFVVLEAMPLTGNGKIDRRALPAPEGLTAERENQYVAPRDMTERWLVSIWEELLHTGQIGVLDNFFSLGGHSLLAVRLIADVQKQFGKTLPLTALYQGGTIADIAELLRDGAEQADNSSLVPIQMNGSRAPLFLVHPAGGTVNTYVELTRALGSDQPVYGLRSQGLAAGEERLTSVVDMAAHYIAALRLVQPEGPYHLGGWSLGGVIAQEMACQLQDAGEQVALLTLIDTPTPAFGQQLEAAKGRSDLFRTFLSDIAAEFGLGMEDAWESEELEADQALEALLSKVQAQGLLTDEAELASARRYLEVFRANMTAWALHEPKRFTGAITLFRATAEQNDLRAANPTLGWSELARDVHLHDVEGTHHTLVEQPGVAEIAGKLQATVDTSVRS